MKNLLIAMCALSCFVLGCGDKPIEESTANQSANAAQRTTGNSKADAAEKRTSATGQRETVESEGDACAHFKFYDDGKCDLDCSQPDPDCARGAPESDQLDFLCGHIEGKNGVCMTGCGSLDPDCDGQEEELPEAEPSECAETYSDRDGRCDQHCFPQDEDCIAQDDLCYDEYRYADGTCDTDCNFADPDCSEEALPSGLISDSEASFCVRLRRNEGPDLARELATSLCMERKPSNLPNCVAACLSARD